MANALKEFQRAMEKRREEGFGWTLDGVDDWSTEALFEKLREAGVDTDAQLFAAQAAQAQGFDALGDRWREQFRQDRKDTLWEDLPLLAIPVLWDRLAAHVVCPDSIEQHLYRAIEAQESGKPLADVNEMPADVAAALKLVEYLEAFEPARRGERFERVEKDRYYDYHAWLSEMVENRAAEYPDAMTRLADVMSDCGQRARFQGDLAVGLARAGRRDEAIARARANVEQFGDDVWVRIMAGDVFDKLGDDAEAIGLWLSALPMARKHFDWAGAMERLEDAYEKVGRAAELEELRRAHPEPARDVTDEDHPSDAPAPMMPPWSPPQFDSDLDVPVQLKTARTVGRNDPCPCGSGKKYKKCCMR